jgi:hypothetical protein
MLKLGSRQSAVGSSAVTLAVLLLVWAGITVAWPYLKYDDLHRAAAGHLDGVKVEGFDYVGESGADPSALSRFWIRREAVSDPASVVRYDSRALRRDMPGRDSLSKTRYEQEIGWLSLTDNKVPCDLSAWQVRELTRGAISKISAEDRQRVNRGEFTLIRVNVACGGG